MAISESLQSLYNTIYTLTGVNPIIFLAAFALVFGVVYAVTSKMDLFKDKRGLSVGISLAFALIVATSPMIGNLFAKALPGVGIFMIFMMLVIFSVALIIPETKTPGKITTVIIVVIIIIVVGYFFFTSYDFQSADFAKLNFAGLSLTREDLSTLIIVAIFIGLILFGASIVKGGGSS